MNKNTERTTNPDVFDLGFKVELLQRKNNAPAKVVDKPDDKHHFIPEGEYMIAAVGYKDVPDTTVLDGFGRPYVKASHFEVKVAPVGCKDPNEFDVIEIAKEDKAVYKFKSAINKRSGGDMAYKFHLAGFSLADIDIKTVCKYMHKYPVKMRSEHTEFVNEQGDTIRSKYPKIRLWNPEDFMKSEEVAWDTLD